MSLDVLAAGMMTSVQGCGRTGARASGVRVGGAADSHSLHVANLLVGNDPGAAALEITLTGPTLRFRRATTIALCGATTDAHAGGIALPGWRPMTVPAGCVLDLGVCRRGARAYLAIDGGIDVPVVLGSPSTDLRGGFGGHAGRALRTGDSLSLGKSIKAAAASSVPGIAIDIAPWWIDGDCELDFSESGAVRVLPGCDATSPVDALFSHEFTADPASDRQGLRLRGPCLHLVDDRERISEPIVPGTLQLPPDGHPIVLLSDAQTVGGYPRIGHVIAADMPRLAQRRAGERLRFIPVDPLQAQIANAELRGRHARIALAIAARR